MNKKGKEMETPNLTVIQAIAEDDKEFQDEILSILKKEFAIETENFKKHFEAKRYSEASDSVHKLKHKISLVGLEKGLILAATYEKALKKGDIKLHEKFIDILHKIDVYLYG